MYQLWREICFSKRNRQIWPKSFDFIEGSLILINASLHSKKSRNFADGKSTKCIEPNKRRSSARNLKNQTNPPTYRCTMRWERTKVRRLEGLSKQTILGESRNWPRNLLKLKLPRGSETGESFEFMIFQTCFSCLLRFLKKNSEFITRVSQERSFL